MERKFGSPLNLNILVTILMFRWALLSYAFKLLDGFAGRVYSKKPKEVLLNVLKEIL